MGEKTKQRSNRMTRRDGEGKEMIRGKVSRKRNQEGDEKRPVVAVEEEKTEETRIGNKRKGAEKQCPGSVWWRQARWLQGTEHPAKNGHRDPALSYFL